MRTFAVVSTQKCCSKRLTRSNYDAKNRDGCDHTRHDREGLGATTHDEVVVVSQYDSHAYENDAGDVLERIFSPNARVRAEIGPRSFTGRVLEAGYDGEPVIYVEDHAGHERAVRFQRETHVVEPAGGEMR